MQHATGVHVVQGARFTPLACFLPLALPQAIAAASHSPQVLQRQGCDCSDLKATAQSDLAGVLGELGEYESARRLMAVSAHTEAQGTDLEAALRQKGNQANMEVQRRALRGPPGEKSGETRVWKPRRCTRQNGVFGALLVAVWCAFYQST